MNIRFLPQVISCSFLLFTMTTTSTATETRRLSETKSSSIISNSWFREKYLQNSYDEYYDYTLTRYKLEDNDYDVCPDFHKSSIFFAITDQHMNRVKKTCSTIYVQKTTKISTSYENKIRDIQITIMDILEVLRVVACYTFEISMLIMSVILASCSTLFMIILMFCQY